MIKKSKRVKVSSSKVIFSGRVFGVKRERVIEPGGIQATREFVTHPGSVVILPVLEDGRILMIRQYRHSVGQYLWELVAGRKDPGETFGAAARRELAEETGYTARRMQKLMNLFPTPGFVSERMVVFLARGLKKGPAHPEVDEKITQRLFTTHEIERWLRAGIIRDAKSVAALLFYTRFLAPKR